MTHITYLTFAFATQDKLSASKHQRIARDLRDSFLVMADPDDLGLVKEADLDYELPQPFGHTHYSDENTACQSGHQNCYSHAIDQVHPTDND